MATCVRVNQSKIIIAVGRSGWPGIRSFWTILFSSVSQTHVLKCRVMALDPSRKFLVPICILVLLCLLVFVNFSGGPSFQISVDRIERKKEYIDEVAVAWFLERVYSLQMFL